MTENEYILIMKKTLSSALLTLLLLAAAQLVMAQEISLNPNQIKAVENASFTGLNGNKINLKDYRGKVVMIDFWDTWCHPCVSSMPTENQLIKDFPKRFAVIAVAAGFNDSKSNVKRFIQAHNYQFHYAYGSDLTNTLMITGIPYKVFIGPKGKFLKVEMGSYGEKQDYQNIKKIIVANTKP